MIVIINIKNVECMENVVFLFKVDVVGIFFLFVVLREVCE